MEYTVKVYGGKYVGSPWFAPELVVHYEPDYNEEVYKNIRRDIGRRYVRFIDPILVSGDLTAFRERIPFCSFTADPLNDPQSYVMRRAINGPVTERVEPPDNIITRPLDDLEGTKGTYTHDNRPFLTEYLYVDYQAEKHRSECFQPSLTATSPELNELTSGDRGTAEWRDLPNRPLKEGEILYMSAENGAQAWDGAGEPRWTRWVTIEETSSDAQS